MKNIHLSTKRALGTKAIGLASFLAILFSIKAQTAAAIFAPDRAGAGSSQCSNLDVVFLIDQSGSMSGADGSAPTDPTEQRRFAPEAMIDFLIDTVLDQCPGAFHRMAVVSYGTDVHTDLELSDIAPPDAGEAQTLRERLKDNIQAKRMGQTNPVQAFQVAKRILDGAAAVGSADRKRVIIFVTDGHPCLASLGCNPPNSTMDVGAYGSGMHQLITRDFAFDPMLLAREQCLAQLRQEYSQRGETIPPTEINQCAAANPVVDTAYLDSTYIFTILLNFGQAYSRLLHESYELMSQEHAGRVFDLTANRNDIPATFQEIMEQLIGVRVTRLTCGNFAINPFVDTAKIVLFKTSADIVVRLSYQDAQGKRHELAGGEAEDGFDVTYYKPYGANERYELHRPYPGIWSLESDRCDGINAYYEPVLINPQGWQPNWGQIRQYQLDPYYDPHQPQYLEYQMRDQSGNVVLPSDRPEFPVNVTAIVTDPTGQPQPAYKLKWNAEQRQFLSLEPLKVPTEGTYTINITGTVAVHEGEPAPVGDDYSEVFNSTQVLFQHLGAEFNVTPVTPFVMQVLTPTVGAQLMPIHGALNRGWPLQVQPIPVRVQIVDQSGQPLSSLEDILTNADTALSAIVSGGGKTSDPLVLKRDPEIPGGYVGEISGFDFKGPQQLTVTLESSPLPDYRPAETSVTVNFSRADFLWTTPAFYGVLLVALLLTIVLFIVRQFAIRTSPVTGTLVLRDSSSTIARFSLNSGKNWASIGPNTLSEDTHALRDYLQLDLKRIEVRNLTPPKPARRRRPNSENDLGMDDGYFEENNVKRVRVKYENSRSRGTKTADLDAGIPSDYGGDTIAQMIYEPL